MSEVDIVGNDMGRDRHEVPPNGHQISKSLFDMISDMVEESQFFWKSFERAHVSLFIGAL